MGKTVSLEREVVGRFGDGHQAAELQAGQAGHGVGERGDLIRCHPALRCFAADVHLYAHIEFALFGIALLRQALRNLFAVDRMNPVEPGQPPAASCCSGWGR
jgi:hypothetical protein